MLKSFDQITTLTYVLMDNFCPYLLFITNTNKKLVLKKGASIKNKALHIIIL